MGIWKKLFGADDGDAVDYYREGIDLLNAGKYHEALTSFRLAQRETPRDIAVLQQIAITYTKIGMTDEAIKTYRSVLAQQPRTASAHYGLAFLLLRQGRPDEAERHLDTFLLDPPDTAEAQRHIEHARGTLDELRRGNVPDADPATGQGAAPGRGGAGSQGTPPAGEA
jgi:tetratricopeptide (TPR) repeat protein